MIKSGKLKKLAIWLLYLLPIVFFAICYFLLTATAEDVAQGCNITPNIWDDFIGAFQSDGRIADMYAWAAINFFDYQYSFGVDTIFRLIDVLAVAGVLALLASLILGHRPRQKLGDALIFMGCFLFLVLTPYGYTFYRGFSMIHNYLIISLALLGFGLPFARKLSNGKIPKIYHKWWFALLIGLIFGLSANFPPIAFIFTYAIIKIWQLWQNKKHHKTYNLRPEAWECFMIGGMLVSMLFGYIVGPGVSYYVNDPYYVSEYDYIAISDILQDFGGSTIRIVRHIVMNFARILIPIIIILLFVWIAVLLQTKGSPRRIKFLPESVGQRRLIAGLTIFSIFSILIGSQILIPIRLRLPAYFALIIVITILIMHWRQELKIHNQALPAAIMLFLAIVVTIIKTTFTLDFHIRIGEVLTQIENSDEHVVYINPEGLQTQPKLPYNMFQQEEIFVLDRKNDYNIYIYGKRIDYEATSSD